jgi:hypothetical protein
MSVEQIETVFTISDSLRKRASELVVNNWNRPSKSGNCNITWIGTKGSLNSCFLSDEGNMFCSCEAWTFKGKNRKFELCKHLLQSMYFLVFVNELSFLSSVIENYLRRE